MGYIGPRSKPASVGRVSYSKRQAKVDHKTASPRKWKNCYN